MKMTYILNPSAGNGKCGRRWEAFERNLKNSLGSDSYEVHCTSRPGEAKKFSNLAVLSGCKQIIVVGGDGTVNEVVNGVIGSDVSIGILPFGTGNDLARSLGIPKSDDQLLNLLCKPKELDLNVAHINERYFVMAAGLGFDGLVANYINSHFNIKKLGAFGYFCSALKILATFKPFEVQVSVDGYPLQIFNTWMLATGNCPYYGGGMRLFPTAQCNDDLLDICVVSNLEKLKFLQVFPTVYSGRHVELQQYITMMRGKSIEIKTSESMVAHADGELMITSALRINVSEYRLRFLTT
ncbi:diacylglycerol/lipid kinase family protein [Alicyclobacillus dauci]|uniref:Diacylglycerol kinase family lipid kinase n=1 Tax=Alicyclobacillus dauci TaxID=1475485 RepID=A0ABY6Z658_9BACL|nr:diacylglycerol kinase family protein [Alicyclobacillus dauci]WAH37505.1 diacylglycerol kinase family lipid kinase [Alicyclobacillus dauci]